MLQGYQEVRGESQAKVFVVYGPRGAGKTTTVVRLAELLAAQGIAVGGYFQRVTTDDQGRRGYDLVRVADRTQTLALARPGAVEQPGTSTVCSFAFDQGAFAQGLQWLQRDCASAQVLVLDEISKLEVRGEGHAGALRWCLGLDSTKLLLLSVRGDQLFYVVEAFGLDERIAGYLEIPAGQEAIGEQVRQIKATLAA